MRQPVSPWHRLPSYRMAGALALVLAVLVLAVNEFSFAADERATAQRDFASDARLAVGRLRRVVVGMESAQRGFMLTARPEYRAPYDSMLGQTAQGLESVRQLAARRPAQRDTLEQLAVLSERKFSELAEVMRLLDAGNTKAERGRLARELHDELGGLLTAAKMDLACVRKRLADSGPELAERIAHLGRTLDLGIAVKRNIIENLRPSALQNLGLPRTPEILCSDFAKASEIPVDADIADLKLSGEPALTLYRVSQEALTNIAKYAKAQRVRVSLEALPGQVRVTVQDDGMGFTPGQARVGSHGLAGMRFRAQSCGGTARRHSLPRPALSCPSRRKDLP